MIYINDNAEVIWLPVNDRAADGLRYFVFDTATMKEALSGDLDEYENTRWPNMMGVRGALLESLKELDADTEWCFCAYEAPVQGAAGLPVCMSLFRVVKNKECGDNIIERL